MLSLNIEACFSSLMAAYSTPVGEEAFASAEDAGMPTTANEQRHERAKYEAYRSERQKGASDENARKQEVAAEKQLFD